MKFKALLLVAACLPHIVHAKNAKTDAEILSSFNAIVSQCKAAFARESHVYEQPTEGRWSKQAYSLFEIKYDVKRTDSLVSPYTGKIILSYIAAAAVAPTKEAALALEVNTDGAAVKQNNVFNFAFQDGAWKTTSAEKSTSFRTKDSSRFDRPMETTSSVEQLRRGSGPERDCVI